MFLLKLYLQQFINKFLNIMKTKKSLSIIVFISLLLTINVFVKAQGTKTNNQKEPLFPVGKDGKWGYINKTGKIVVPIKFDDIDKYNYDGVYEGDLIAVKINGKWGYCDKTGKMVIEAKYSSAEHFTDGIAKVSIKEKSDDFAFAFNDDIGTYINKQGSIVFSGEKYKATGLLGTSYFSDGLMCVKGENKKYGFIDTKGVEVIKCKFNYAKDFSDGLAVFTNGKLYGFIDKTGKKVIDTIYTEANDFSEGIAICKDKSGKTIFIDKKGMIVGKTDEKLKSSFFSFSYRFQDGLLKYEKDGKVGFLDKTGKIVIQAKYDDVHGVSNGLIGVCLNGTKKESTFGGTWENGWGFIDKTGKIVIPCKYKSSMSFTEGVVSVKEGEKWGIMDKTGKWIIKPEFEDYPENCKNGLIKIKGKKYYNGQFGYIDKTGKWIWQMPY